MYLVNDSLSEEARDIFKKLKGAICRTSFLPHLCVHLKFQLNRNSNICRDIYPQRNGYEQNEG